MKKVRTSVPSRDGWRSVAAIEKKEGKYVKQFI